MIRVNEWFGPTLQGEGPSQGQRAWFLRLSGCNLTCVWCDTPYTWDWTGKNGVAYDRAAETVEWEIADLAEMIRPALGSDLLVITGGEPLIQQRALGGLLDLLDARVEIETNGTRPPQLDGVRYNVSPKLENAGCEGSWRPDVLDQFPADRTILKFVITEPGDFAELEVKLKDLTVDFPVWVMPEGKTRAEILDKLDWVFSFAADRGWAVTPRLHVLAFDDLRGV